MDTEALRRSLLSKFKEVTADRLEKIGLALLALEKDPKAEAPAEDVARELHTMKGEARMLSLPRIGELAHAAEDLLKSTREGRSSLHVATDQLLQACDLIGELLEQLDLADKPHPASAKMVESLLKAAGLSELSGRKPVAAMASPSAALPKSRFAPDKPAADKKPEEKKPEARPPEKKAAEERPPEEKPAAEPPKADARSIRVAVEVLDLLGALAGDLLVEGARAHLRSHELSLLVQRFNRIGDRFLGLADLVSARLPDQQAGLGLLEADLHLLRDDIFRFVRKNSDGVNALRGHLDRLAEQVAEARLVPLSTVFTAFPRAVRDIARDQSKEVELAIANAEVGVDRNVLGEVRDAMVHLLRNSVDHGIEAPETREQAGKPRKGRIGIGVRADGGMLAVEVEDDGKGIDPAKVRQKAVSSGLLPAAHAAALTEREVMDLIFLPGFSTKEEVTELSGRGVGMAVVKKKVEALGGSVSIASKPGKGTRISLRLPQSMALMRVLLVRLGKDVYGVPASDVQAVGRVRPQDKMLVAGRQAVTFRGRATTLVELAPLLRLAGGKHEAPQCIFVEHGEDRAAFTVDGFIGEREVAVKPCGGEFLKGAPCVAGAAALEDGRVAVLLHVPDLMMQIRKTAGRAQAGAGQERRLRVLLVDDSPIARATESALVRALGHQVDEACDGEDGLSKVALQTYDLILSDIQMPKMDGIEMTRRIKTDPATSRIPIVILSSLASPEDKRRGLDAGANAYLVKGELSTEALSQTLGQLVG